jgi:predicted GNAT family N-acyltransferase
VGAALTRAAITHFGALGLAKAKLSAQTSALPFYENLGFIQCSEVYMEDDIPHIKMIKS